MRRAIATAFASLPDPRARVVVTVDGRWPDDGGPWKTQSMDVTKSNHSLVDLARQADYTVLIAPETMGVLADLANTVETAGAVSLGCSARAIELTGNKSRLAEWLQAQGIATPACRTVMPAQGLPRDTHYPAVLKPVDGAGSVDTYWVADAEDLPPAARAMPVALLQPFHASIPMSASFLVGADRAWLIGIGRQRVAIQNGRIVYRGGVLPVCCGKSEPLLRRAVESVAGLRGFVGLDFLWDEVLEQTLVLEINPRATTSFVGLTRLLPAGRLAAAWMAACGVPGFDRHLLGNLAEVIHRQPPIGFDSDGTIWPAHQVISS